MYLLRLYMVAAGLLVPGAAAQAEVFKCKGTDGTVVFSDHACAADQTSSSVPGITKSAPKAAASPEQAKDPSLASAAHDAKQRALNRRISAGMSPECREIGEQLGQTLRQDSTAEMADSKRLLTEFQQRCMTEFAKVWKAEQGKVLDLASCKQLRQLVDKSRARLSRMTDKEKMDYAKLQNEVSVACP
ncbi:DUF4124 domain-containing protein [Rhodoferax sp.]|uniref:DUF4124 domain-containing protein n=1 Tax=Rhodoferax sp. TaxID=50421 RepID=UPI002ACD352E|nr:DUF4124 domain-containing protein [Rhodoferax sp.]MDZ7921530.1 DUF4124 domain-containing protein [Rhodoferax sp.]